MPSLGLAPSDHYVDGFTDRAATTYGFSRLKLIFPIECSISG